jgi:hypothetical protein
MQFSLSSWAPFAPAPPVRRRSRLSREDSLRAYRVETVTSLLPKKYFRVNLARTRQSIKMPEYNGVKVSVYSQVEQTIHSELPHLHPEFPHPETSQFTYRATDLRTSFDWTPPSAGSDSKADRLLGRQSSVAVYIPSVPGTHSLARLRPR